MNKKMSGIVCTILSILILIYFESIIYKILFALGININSFSNIIQIICNILIKFLMCFIIYILYKKDFRKRNSTNNIIKRFILFIIYLLALIVLMYTFKHINIFIGNLFKVNIIEHEFYNIFNKTLNISLIIKIIIDYIVTPFLYCTIILLGTDKLCKNKETFILMSGIIASIIYAFSLEGTLIYVIINSLYMFVLFSLLAFIYKRENNIWMIILLYGFYLISNNIIVNYLGW